MNSTLLKKYETIEQSKVSEKDKKVLEQVKKLSNNFEETDEAKNKVAEKILDQIIKINPDAIKKPQVVAQKVAKVQKVAKAKKVAQAKKTATTTPKKSDNNIMSVAKEIQKDGESWKDAMERAKQVLKERKEQVVQKQKTELEKLYALVKTKKELKGFANSDIRRDSVRDAKPRGARFVTKEGTTSNGYGTFPNKLGRKYWETRDRHADRLAPNYPKDMPLLASGGAVSDAPFSVEVFKTKLRFDNELPSSSKGDFPTFAKAKEFAIDMIDNGNYYAHINSKSGYLWGVDSKGVEQFDNGGMFEAPIGVMREVKGKTVSVPVSEEIYSSEINRFVDYVDGFYGKKGIYAEDLDGGFTKAEIKKAVNKYVENLNANGTWGGGDSLDRERVRQILQPSYKMADGGAVSDEKIWDLLHKEEKLNFITKNKSEIEKKIKLNQDIISKSIKNDNWDSLNEDIKNVFNKHIQNKKFYFENIGKEVTWEDFKGVKREGVIDDIDFNGNYVIANEFSSPSTLSPDEVKIKDKKRFWLFSNGGMNNLTMQNVSFEKGGIFYKEGSNKYGLGNTEIFIQEENDMYCVYDNVYNDENENWEIKKLADFDDMDEAKEFAIEHSKKEYADGGAVYNERMYNFLKDDLGQLEEAIKSGDMEEVNRFFSYWLGSSGHLKSLETKNNERMYNFLKEDLEKLMGAVEDNDTEEVERFFSYWGQHLESLKMANGGDFALYKIQQKSKYDIQPKWEDEKFQTGGRKFLTFKQAQDIKKKLQGMSSSIEYKVVKVGEDEKLANGGSLPFMTDPNFGNFQNTGMFEGGGLVVKNNQDLEEVAKYMFNAVKKRKWDLKDLIYYFEKENNFDYKYRVKIWDEMNGYEMRKTYENILEMLKRIVEANGKKFELGGAFMMTDLAGHTGGSDGIGNPMPLSGVSGTHYTGLVGETGAMSSGELFEAGGAMMQNQQVINDASQSYVNYYLGEGVGQGIYKDGGSIPDNYAGRTPEDVWNNLSKQQRSHFLYDHIFEIEDYKKIEKLPSSQIIKAYNSEWSSLDKDIKNRFSNHVREGQYAKGGSLGKALYVEYSSYFDYNKYDTDKIISTLEGIGAKNIRLENDRGWSNQPEVVVFNGSKNQAVDALNEAFDTDYIRVSEKDWRTKKMADGGSVGDDFEEVIDLGAEQYYTRPFGIVESESNDEVELVVVATIKDLERYMSEDELPEEGNFQLDITLVPTEEFISEEMLESANDEDSSVSDDSVVNLVNYAGGLNYSPQERVFFESHQDALDYLMSEELKDQINKDAFSSDYIMYEKYNRAGQTNSDYLDYLMGVTDRFAKGGSVDDSVIDELWSGYASAVLFTETDSDSGEPLDSEYSVSDFDEETESSTKKMLAKFYLENKDAIEESELDLDTIGNDVWYTRSGQGAGFFDHSLDAEVEEKLTKGAKALGEYPSVETYDGKISVRGGRVLVKGGFVGTVEFNVGDVVWQKDEKRYATVMNNYGDPINGDGGEVRLDTTGNTPIFTYDKKTYENTGYNLVKVGEKGDTGKFTPKVLDEMKESANRLIDSRKQSKDKEGVAYYQQVYKRLLDGEFDSMTGAKATSSQKSISNETTYVPNRDVKELSVVIKGELKQLKGSDIVDGVYVKNSAKSSSKADANAVFAKILKDAKEAKQGKSKRFDASDLKKINLEMVQKLAEAGYSEQQIRNVILGYAFDNEIVAENELEYDKGVFSYEESYVKEKIDDLVDAQKNKEFSVGIEYPNFDWKSIVKKYKITLKPKDVVVKKTMGDGSRYDYYYEVFVGENIVLGHNYGYKNFDKNGKLKDDYLEKGKKVSDPTKQNSWQKERGQKAGFNGGYWYVVSSKIEIIDDVLKTLLSQEDGYCKELELYSDSFAKTLKENNVEFADGGLLSSNEIDKLDSGFTISQLDDMLRKMFPYSFGVDVFKAGKNLFDYNLDDKIKDDKLKLYFYDKSSNRELNYEVHQGQENTYFDFMLFDEEMNTYIGTFGFKDRGDVDKSYITKFVSFLHDAYHYPFQVRHSVMADGGFMSDVYAKGGGVSDYMNSPEYKEMFNKMQKLTLDVKSRVVRAVGLDSAIEFYDSDYPVRPYQLLERAVRGGFITLDDINERVVDSAMETAQDSEDDEEVGSSDFTSYLHNFLDEAGFKVGYVNGKLTREFADGGSMNGSGEVNVKKRNFDVIIMPKKLEIEVQITRADTVDQYGLNDAEVEWHQERWGYVIKADDNKKFNKALRVLGITQKYADGGMFSDNDGFMKADNNRNFRYSEKEVYVETIDEPIDLTDYTEDRTNEVDIRTIDNDIDLTDDRKVKARLTQPKRGNGEKFLAIAPRAFEFMGENIPMPSSNKHKND